VVLALGAVVLTHFNLPGALPAFLLAALALVVGIVGLLLQAREERRLAALPKPPRPKVHREGPCAIEMPLLHKLARAEAVLEGRLREHNWDADWAVSRKHHEQAQRFLNEGDRAGAFREYCRAMRPLTEAMHRQRNKEEVFQPVWDKAAD
jgi:hypothetical protein